MSSKTKQKILESSSAAAASAKPTKQRLTLQEAGVENASSSANAVVDEFGVDSTWNAADFESRFDVRIISLNDHDMEFDLIGIDASIANAIRRVLLSEVSHVTRILRTNYGGRKQDFTRHLELLVGWWQSGSGKIWTLSSLYIIFLSPCSPHVTSTTDPEDQFWSHNLILFDVNVWEVGVRDDFKTFQEY